MGRICIFSFLFAVMATAMAKDSSAKVQLYSREPGFFEMKNHLVCHVSDFYPPEISIELLKGGEKIPGAQQTDLAFESNWHYHLTKTVAFTPKKGERYSCMVTHMGQAKTYMWEPDM
ncbi:beta-2-microglobulin-like [Genypterus blacodes]|uniref:beta-2-microglobulin-like n=1 Tax=Genypterus blacodes TaxID=154954 RepID=UPI003F765998